MNVQLKKGALEIAVLSLISKHDEYGYSLFRYINDKVVIAEGTLYPLLRRMVKEKLLSTYYRESREGPPRKYYSITEDGKLKLKTLIKDWKEFSSVMDYFIEWGEKNEQAQIYEDIKEKHQKNS